MPLRSIGGDVKLVKPKPASVLLGEQDGRKGKGGRCRAPGRAVADTGQGWFVIATEGDEEDSCNLRLAWLARQQACNRKRGKQKTFHIAISASRGLRLAGEWKVPPRPSVLPRHRRPTSGTRMRLPQRGAGSKEKVASRRTYGSFTRYAASTLARRSPCSDRSAPFQRSTFLGPG